MNTDMQTVQAPPSPPLPQEQALQSLYKTPQNETGPVGLGGWLILVAIGLIISPFRIAFVEFHLLSLFLNGTWTALANSSSEFYSPYLAIIIPFEFVFNMAFIFGFIFLIYLYFTKSSIFPKWYIGIYLANLAMIVLDMLVVKLAVPEAPLFDPETSGELLRSIGACVIWIPYMLQSKRVANTFVE